MGVGVEVKERKEADTLIRRELRTRLNIAVTSRWKKDTHCKREKKQRREGQSLAGSSAAHLSVRSPKGESLTMAVVGLDIGDHSAYISLARQGGVDTIANDYTQRATPTIVALGGRQRFMGVSAENQRNLTVKNTVSYFKNFLGRKYKDEYVDQERGAGGRRGEAEVRRSGGRGGERDPEQPGRDEQEEGEGVGHLLVQQDWGKQP